MKLSQEALRDKVLEVIPSEMYEILADLQDCEFDELHGLFTILVSTKPTNKKELLECLQALVMMLELWEDMPNTNELTK